MCGINGFTWEDESLVEEMNDAISYRGPDDAGVYSDQNISLGHRRLSILDLSKAGHQPMSDKEGKVWIVFNGEIYNYQDIRERLQIKGYRFSSNTDTEVIIAAYMEYGHKCLNLFNGMFSFAIWDTRKKELFLARDRMGIKPLYYFYDGSRLIFSSEIKAILKHNITRTINTDALNSFFTYRFIPSHKTVLEGIEKIQPGYYAVYKDGDFDIRKYWDITWKKSKETEKQLIQKLENLLFSSVERRLMSDVPLGAYLSGGVDSSLIAAINSKLRQDPVKTFTVGFGHESDEFSPAKQVAGFLGTNHKELRLDYGKVTRKLPEIIHLMDEPNSDITMVPLYFLSQFSKKDATVINTGEGADELFSGYYHYRIGASIMKPIPKFIKKSVYSWYYSPFKNKDRQRLFTFDYKEDKTLPDCMTEKTSLTQPRSTLSRILKFDLKHEIPNWQLARVDRMTMAHGQEARVPFLDHTVVNFATSIPNRFKQPGLQGKMILKKLALNYLPKDIVMRKKQGFTTPMHSWIKNNLEEASEAILLNGSETHFSQAYIKDLIEKHKSTSKPKPFQLYSYQLLMLMFYQMWHDMYVERISQKEIEKKLMI